MKKSEAHPVDSAGSDEAGALAALAEAVREITHAPAGSTASAPLPRRGCPWFAAQSPEEIVRFARSELDEVGEPSRGRI